MTGKYGFSFWSSNAEIMLQANTLVEAKKALALEVRHPEKYKFNHVIDENGDYVDLKEVL